MNLDQGMDQESRATLQTPAKTWASHLSVLVWRECVCVFL